MKPVKISKEYKWEMGHRLQFHPGKCKNVHGHSYKMVLEVEGKIKQDGMLIDFYELDKIVNPFIEELDHSFMCHDEDKELAESLEKLKSKIVPVKYFSTVENMSLNFAEYFAGKFLADKAFSNIKKLSVKVFETADSFAESVKEL